MVVIVLFVVNGPLHWGREVYLDIIYLNFVLFILVFSVAHHIVLVEVLINRAQLI